MGCSACGVSCDSSCAIISYSDCSVCWVDAPAMAAKTIMDMPVTEGKTFTKTATGTRDDVIKQIGFAASAD